MKKYKIGDRVYIIKEHPVYGRQKFKITGTSSTTKDPTSIKILKLLNKNKLHSGYLYTGTICSKIITLHGSLLTENSQII